MDLSSLTNGILDKKVQKDLKSDDSKNLKGELKQSENPLGIEDVKVEDNLEDKVNEKTGVDKITEDIYGSSSKTAKTVVSDLYNADKAFDKKVYGENGSGRKETVKAQDDYLSKTAKNISNRSDLYTNQQSTLPEVKGWSKDRPENPLATSTRSKYDYSKDNIADWPSELPSALSTAGLDAASNTLLLKIRADGGSKSAPSISEYSDLFKLDDLVDAHDFCGIYGSGEAPPLGILIRKVDLPKLQLNTYTAQYAKKTVIIPTRKITTSNEISLTLYDDMFGSTAKALVLASGYNFLGEETSNKKFLFQETAPNGLSPSYYEDRWIKNAKGKTKDRKEEEASSPKSLEAVLYTIYFEHHYALNKEKIEKLNSTPYVFPMMIFKNVKFVNFSEAFETENDAKEKTFTCKMIFEKKELL